MLFATRNLQEVRHEHIWLGGIRHHRLRRLLHNTLLPTRRWAWECAQGNQAAAVKPLGENKSAKISLPIKKYHLPELFGQRFFGK
jgi:hypothetical protein